MEPKEKEIVVTAPSYREFADKVRAMTDSNSESARSLAFHKAVGKMAVYVNAVGDRTYYVWERSDE